MNPIHPQASIFFAEDVLEAERARIGEDPFTGVAPVEEALVDVELKLDEEVGDLVELKPLEEGKAKRRLGKMPTEAMFWLLVAKYGTDWFIQVEPEVLMEDFLKKGVFIDGGGFSKMMALKCLLQCPDHESPFHTHWKSFLHMTCSLVGRPVKWHELSIPTPLETALAMHISLELRPMVFQPQVRGVIAALCLHAGIWVLPGILGAAKEEMLQHLRYHKIPLGQEDIDEVRSRIVKHLQKGESSDDVPVPGYDASDKEETIQGQVIRVMDLQERLGNALLHGERAKDRVWEVYEDELQARLKEKDT